MLVFKQKRLVQPPDRGLSRWIFLSLGIGKVFGTKKFGGCGTNWHADGLVYASIYSLI